MLNNLLTGSCSLHLVRTMITLAVRGTFCDSVFGCQKKQKNKKKKLDEKQKKLLTANSSKETEVKGFSSKWPDGFCLEINQSMALMG